MPLDSQRLTDRIYKTITKSRDLDPLTLAEKIAERVTDYLEDCGVVDGVQMAGSAEEAREQIRNAREADTVGPRRPRLEPVGARRPVGPPPAPPKESRLILTPDDPEFQRAQELAQQESQRPERVTAAARVSKIGQTQAGESETVYWTVETLIPYLEKQFPPAVVFTPNDMEPHVKIKAVRNIQAMINAYGANGVRLTYAHEGINQNGMDPTNPVGDGLPRVNIAPVASHLFSCADQTIDREAVLDKIADQLCGLYAPRRQHMEPGYIGEPPIDSWNASNPGMRDNDAIRGAKGWSNVADPQRQVLDGVFDLNTRVGTPGWKPGA